MSRKNKHRFYVGTYTLPILFGTGEILESRGRGIDLMEFDADTGSVEYLLTAAITDNPSYLVPANSGKYLFAVNELKEFEGEETGAVSSFRIEHLTGRLEFVNQQKTGGTDPCHIQVDSQDRYVYTSNFMSGSVGVLPVADDGSLGELSQFIQHEGSSVLPARQAGPHAHSLTFDKEEAYALVPDLGIDKLMVYRTDFDNPASVLNAAEPLSVFPGAGPRHCAFDQSGKHCYLINELASSITLFHYDGLGGFELKQTISTLDGSVEGANICADIHLTPDGRYLYGSNRGHDSIAAYRVSPTDGQLEYIASCSCGGRTPRNFAVDPTGCYLVVANQDSDNIVTFAIDPDSGLLTECGRIECPTPVCVKFIPEL